MKKHHLLTALLAISVAAFFGCKSGSDSMTTGPGGPELEGSDTEQASANDIDNPESGHPSGSASFGKFSAIRFETDSASIRPGDRGTLNQVGDYLKNNPSAKILVAGNCDERGTAEYNRALGQRRAQAARSALRSKGISADRISTVSYGEDKPVGSWEQNRRDDFGIIE